MIRMGKMIYLFSLLIMAAFTSKVWADQQRAESVYTSPEGISFISYSKKWDGAKLETLYRMLLNCGHGEEFGLLKQVILDPKNSTGESGYRVGSYDYNERTIRLYEVDTMPVERTMIHEYGHHFTYYWLKKKDGVYPFELTERHEWSKLRELDGYPIRFVGTGLPYQHRWDPGEIMAEDYVLLFGVTGRQPPKSGEDIVNFLRHENEYVPLVYTLPAVREYWEKAAGLKPAAVLSQPEVLDTALERIGPSGNPVLHVKFASAGGAQLPGRGPLQYAIQLMAFPSTGGVPERITFTIASDSGGNDLDCRIPLPEAIQWSGVYYGHLSVWAYQEGSKQFTYTPIYKNWLELRIDNTSNLVAIRDIPPPWEQQGLFEMLRKEGLKRWPIVYLFMNGRVQAAGKRYIDWDGTLYISLRALPHRLDSMTASGEAVLHWNGHEIIFPRGQEQEAIVDGKRTKLKQRIKTIGAEPFIAVNELGRLLGAHAVWKEAEDSIVLEWDAEPGSQV
jgi:hypothetical protein